MVTLIADNLTPAYVNGALRSGNKGPTFPTHATTQEDFARNVLQIAPVPWEHDARRNDRMYRYAECCMALMRETANMLHTSPPPTVPVKVRQWLQRYDAYMSGSAQPTAAPVASTSGSPATSFASPGPTAAAPPSLGGASLAGLALPLPTSASRSSASAAPPSLSGAASSGGGGLPSSSASTIPRLTYTPTEITARSVYRNAFTPILVPLPKLRLARAEDDPKPCSPDCIVHARANAGLIHNAEVIAHMMETKCECKHACSQGPSC